MGNEDAGYEGGLPLSITTYATMKYEENFIDESLIQSLIPAPLQSSEP